MSMQTAGQFHTFAATAQDRRSLPGAWRERYGCGRT